MKRATAPRLYPRWDKTRECLLTLSPLNFPDSLNENKLTLSVLVNMLPQNRKHIRNLQRYAGRSRSPATAGRQKPPCGARPNVAFRLSGPQCGGTDGPPTEKLLSFHGESFEICRGHPLRSRASRMARRRTAGRKTPGRNGFGSKDRRMSSYKHHRFPGYGRFLIRSGLFPTTAPAPCPAACDAFRHPASSFRTGRREHRTTLSALRTAIRKRSRTFPRNVRDARRTEAEDGKSSQSPCFRK